MYQRLKGVMAAAGACHELLFVDDCSQDRTLGLLEEIARLDPCVRIIRLAHHEGKEAALRSGLAHAAGRAVILMDADLQDPPELIPQMLAAWRQGAEAVLMRRTATPALVFQCKTAWFQGHARRFLAHLGLLPENCLDFMLYDRKVLAVLNLTVNRKRYMKAIFSWMGVRQLTIDYERCPRAAGAAVLNSTCGQKQSPCPSTHR